MPDIRGSYRLVKSINKTLTLIADKLQQSADNSAKSVIFEFSSLLNSTNEKLS
ncbi:MAG: hypothetical protein SPL31_11330 [Succinivibrio sp.]|nr:hypothetical protein [Succinatimonas sp.]MDY6262690.1 hypothetical protein [Succinivibrio sp.]